MVKDSGREGKRERKNQHHLLNLFWASERSRPTLSLLLLVVAASRRHTVTTAPPQTTMRWLTGKCRRGNSPHRSEVRHGQLFSPLSPPALSGLSTQQFGSASAKWRMWLDARAGIALRRVDTAGDKRRGWDRVIVRTSHIPYRQTHENRAQVRCADQTRKTGSRHANLFELGLQGTASGDCRNWTPKTRLSILC